MTTSPAVLKLISEIASLRKQVAAQGTSQLAFSALEDGAIREYSLEGTQVAQYGQQYDGTSGAATLVSPTPATPSAPNVAGVAGGLVIGWGGTFADPASGAVDELLVAPMDFARVDVAVGPVGFDPLATPPLQDIASPRGGEVFVSLEAGEYEVALITRTTAGTPSVPSLVVSAFALGIAEPNPSDGSAPASSPAPEALAGIGSVFLRYAAVTNADPVIYKIYGSDTAGFTPDVSTLLATTPATIATVRTLSNGTPLAYGTPYYFRVVAADADGDAPLSAEVSATPRQATTGDIAADFAYLGAVQANQIVSGDLSAAIALLGSLTVGGASGARLQMDPANGLSLFGPDDEALIRFPVDGSNNIFEGDIVARGLTALGRASFRGNDNEISRNSSFTLATGTTRPASAPSMTTGGSLPEAPQSWTVPVGSSRRTSSPTVSPDGVYVARINGTLPLNYDSKDIRIETYTRATGARVQSPAVAAPAGTSGIYFGGGMFDVTLKAQVVRVGGEWVILAGWVLNPTLTDVIWKVTRVNATTWAKVSEWTWTSERYATAGTAKSAVPSLATDGTDLYIGETLADYTYRIKKYTVAGALSSTVTTTPLPQLSVDAPEARMAPVVGSFDYGSLRFLVGRETVFADSDCYPVTAAGALQASEKFNLASFQTLNAEPVKASRLAYWGGRLRGFDLGVQSDYATDTTIDFTSSTFSTRTAASTVAVASTWYDSDPGGTGNHETDLSPVASVTVPARAAVTFQTPPPPDAGDVDSPDTSRFYAGPDAANLHLIGQSVSAPHRITLTDISYAGAAPPVTNSFPDGVAGEIRSTLGGLVLRGDGTGDWPYLLGLVDDAIADSAAQVTTDANTYTDTKAATAETNANTYTDARVMGTEETWTTVPSAAYSTGWSAYVASGYPPGVRWRYAHDNRIIIQFAMKTTAAAGANPFFLEDTHGMPLPTMHAWGSGRALVGTTHKTLPAAFLNTGRLQILNAASETYAVFSGEITATLD